MKSQLSGERFNNGQIPLDVLPDLAALQEMVLEAAKWTFKKENPDHRRSPKGFGAFDLKLASITDGSTTLTINLVPRGQASLDGSKVSYLEYYERGLGFIIEGIKRMGQDGDPSVIEHLPPECLDGILNLTQNLHDDDHIEIGTPNRQAARLDRRLCAPLRQYLSMVRTTQEACLFGTIPEADKKSMTFQIHLIRGGKVTCPMREQYQETILKAFSGYENDVRVQVNGTGLRRKQSRPANLESVTHVAILDDLDVPARLDEFRSMRDGWLEGGGYAPPRDGLDWLADAFQSSYPADPLLLPHTYPTHNGGIQMEWSHGDNRATLEIDLRGRTGEWFFFNRHSDGEFEKRLNLDSLDDWKWLVAEIQDRVMGQP